MATQDSTADRTDFGEVSRVRGIAFKYLSFGASLFGIVALATLLIYVFVDAFGLASVSPGWLLTYFLTLVVPFVGFCLYSADDRSVTRRVVVALGGGLVATAVVFEGIELLVSIPRLNWQLAYLFVVVVPVTAYAVYTASREPTGAAGFGLVGRFYGGTMVGIALGILFLVFDPRLWMLMYTLGVLPAALVFGYSRLRPESSASLFVVPVGLVGLVAAAFVRNVNQVYPTRPLIFLWTLVIPVAAVAAALVLARDGSRRAALGVGAVVVAAGAAGLPVGAVGLPAGSAVAVFAVAAAPTAAYVHQVVQRGEGRVGLLLPVLLAGGAVAGAAAVGTFGFTGPDSWLTLEYLTTAPDFSTPENAGLYTGIVGSVIIIAMVAVLSFGLAVGTAVLLEEYASNTGVVGTVTRLIQVNITNLAAVPSVVYGLLGLGLFANLLGLGLGTAVTAALTLSLLILPITVVSAQEAIRAVPDEMRRGSDAMGATRWQTTKNVVLPEALPGIFTGVILSLGRAIGETAPLIMIQMGTAVYSAPNSLFNKFSAMPMQIYAWSALPQEAFRYGVLAAGVVTLLVVLLSMNATAIILRNRTESDL
ncbi:phosphate ABC transporter permease PstA [Natronomonas marina]|jgi:phosphate transport system permease protein|uniref:phosphate ABC transporter permease PstA n=1 Tax=Natronomonas marina TaxID=2961939 RepID=UPI0020C9BA0C|nr:phosphate ABC transporter permease PstA [Natronomonas marina]